MWYRRPQIVEAMAEYGLTEVEEGVFSLGGEREIICFPGGVTIRSHIVGNSVIETTSMSPSPDEDFLTDAVLDHIVRLNEMIHRVEQLGHPFPSRTKN